MRAKLNTLSAFVVGIVGGALVAACQTYDFEPVEPLALAQTTVGDIIRAKASKPNMMVLLDTSGSMMLPVDPSLSACRLPGGEICGQGPSTPCNTSVCPSRWSELQGAMSRFLSDNGRVARMGLTTYPGPRQAGAVHCTASSSVRIPIPDVADDNTAALESTANEIYGVIAGISDNGTVKPEGGTPTSLSLNFVASQPELQTKERPDFVLLLTDGLPNCNPNNPNTYSPSPPDTCQCTLTAGCANASVVKLGCLDRTASVDAVKALGQQGIQTIVIGFGAETASGAGPDTLNEMAKEGGFARNCEKDPNACGAGDTCDAATKRCGRSFYQAANQQELSQALQDIINRVNDRDPCLVSLTPAQIPMIKVDETCQSDCVMVPDKDLVAAYVDDKPEALENWDLTEQGVVFKGATCERIKSSTDANPVKVEVRAVVRK